MNPLLRELAHRVGEQLDVPADELLPLFTTPPDESMGDYALPCFTLARRWGRAPAEIAAELAETLSGPHIERAQASGPYLNITVDRGALMRAILGQILTREEGYGGNDEGADKTVVIDYSSPNIARPFSVGHLRSTVLGHALKLIHGHLGYRVVGVNHLGDWGKQFGALIAAYKLWGSRDSVNEEGVYELLRLYVKFHEEAHQRPDLEGEARAWFVRLEEGHPEAMELWKWFVAVSLEAFRKYYDMLGIAFEEVRGESAYRGETGPLIERLLQEGIAVESEGAVIIPFEDGDTHPEIPPLILRKQDGATVYPTRDLCAAIYHKEKYDFVRKLYVVDAGQSLHFRQLFKALEKMGCAWARDLVHVAFGVVLFEDRRMSTRRGQVVFFEDVARGAIERTRGIIESIAKASDLRDEEKERVSRDVGVGAVIYAMLSRSRQHDINFRWDEVLNFEGKSGPYIQYTHARLAGVLRKADRGAPNAPDYALLVHAKEVSLARKLEEFPVKVKQAAEQYDPFPIAEYLGDLAMVTNRFYDTCRVLGEEPPLEEARLALVHAAKIVLKTGLELLGMKAPERM